MAAEEALRTFMAEVKQVEARDSVYTSSGQITRLLRPGSSYANLNPFEVLLIDPFEGSNVRVTSTSSDSSEPLKLDMERVRKQYKKLSILCHPDKNYDDKERAQTAFDIVSKAYKSLEEEGSRQRALEMVQEALFKLKQELEEKRKKARKAGSSAPIPEDESSQAFESSLRACTLKLFADAERKRKEREDKDQRERKRKREEEIKTEEEKRAKEEWVKNYEESREERVSSWKSFQKGSKGGKEKKKVMKGMLKPPKPKPETH